MAGSKSSLDNVLQSILAVGNSEQNQTYPPFIFQSQFNAVTSMLLNALVKEYPTNPLVVDMLMPFMKIEKINIKDGYITMPDDYRDLLGSPSVSINKNGEDCGQPIDATGFKEKVLTAGCKTVPVTIVAIGEWDDLTTSTYRFPTAEQPIGCWFGNKKLKICPYNIKSVEVRYAKQEQSYVYGYITQPDDTYIFDPDTTTESEWNNAAFEPLMRSILLLYSIYTRDKDMSDWTLFLKDKTLI